MLISLMFLASFSQATLSSCSATGDVRWGGVGRLYIGKLLSIF